MGDWDSRYEFYVAAVDAVGNEQGVRETVDVTAELPSWAIPLTISGGTTETLYAAASPVAGSRARNAMLRTSFASAKTNARASETESRQDGSPAGMLPRGARKRWGCGQKGRKIRRIALSLAARPRPIGSWLMR